MEAVGGPSAVAQLSSWLEQVWEALCSEAHVSPATGGRGLGAQPWTGCPCCLPLTCYGTDSVYPFRVKGLSQLPFGWAAACSWGKKCLPRGWGGRVGGLEPQAVLLTSQAAGPDPSTPLTLRLCAGLLGGGRV